MSSLTIRDVDPSMRARLCVRAARNSRSLGDEARSILEAAVTDAGAEPADLAASIRRRVRRFGGVVLRLPEREPIRDPPARRG